MRRAAVAVSALAVACAACSIISAADYVGSGPQPADDGGPQPSDAMGAPETVLALEDAQIDASPALVPSVIAGSVVPYGTGRAQQSHLYYAKDAGQWIFFGLDPTSTTRMTTRLSTDFITWRDGASITLPHPDEQDGRDFSVSQLPSSTQTFHLAISLLDGAHFHYQLRATVGQDVTFGSLFLVGQTDPSQTGLSPDGPAVIGTPNGRIIEASGWLTPPDGGYGSGNMITTVSSTNDNGNSWTPVFNPSLQIDTPAGVVNARVLVAQGEGALAVWESGDVEPMPHGLLYSVFDGASWGSIDDVGFESALFDVDDWSAVAIGSSVHVVRWANGYSHRIFNNGQFSAGMLLQTGNYAQGGGLVLLADGTLLRAYVLDPDGAILTASYDAQSWSSWTELLPKGGTRSSLSGYADTNAAVLSWVEQTTGGLEAVGLRLR